MQSRRAGLTILFATEYYPPFAPGGAEWSSTAMAAALGRHGCRVVVVTPNYGDRPLEQRDGVTVYRVPFPVKLRPGQREVRWLVHRNPFFYLYLAWHLRRIARREGVEVIHAQGKGTLVPAWLAARLLGRPVFVTVRDVGLLCPLGMCPLFEALDRFECNTAQYVGRCAPFFLAHYHAGQSASRRFRHWIALLYAWLDHRVRRWALRRVDGVTGVSRGILEVYSPAVWGRALVRVVPTLPPVVGSVPPEEGARVRQRLGIGDGPLVLYAGKLSLGKGVGILEDAIDLISAKVPGVQFAFAGKGDWQLPERPDVHRLGVLDQRDLFALYTAADVVVVPSIWPEPLSRVILEAMTLGRPVVATRVGGSPEAVEDGVTGLLVPKGDAVELARAVSELLLDPERRRRMGEAARRRIATEFNESRLVAAHVEAYRELGGIR